jgi:trk system potassium uptake protein TrkH
VAIFSAVSALSTTGFATVEFSQWNGLGFLVLILFMLVGGGTGSTAGGIKQYRIYVLGRGLVWEFRRRFLPQSAVTEPDVWRGEQRRFISDTQLRQVSMFVFLYLLVFVAGSGIIAAHGYSLRDSLFEFASALSTVGISVGVTSAGAPAGVLWVETAAMFLGRLEFFTIVIGLIRLSSDVPVMLADVGGRPKRTASSPSPSSDTQTVSGVRAGDDPPDGDELRGSDQPRGSDDSPGEPVPGVGE